MDGDYQLDAMSVPQSLEELHDLLALVARDHPEVAASDLMLLETAVIELAGNVVEHGRPEGGVRYRFVLHVQEDCLVAEVSEPGDPVEITGQPPGELDESGRGVLIAQAAVDVVEHDWRDGRNVWTLRKDRRTESP